MADLKAASSISTEKVLVLDERIGDYALAEKGTCNAAYIRLILLAKLVIGNGATISRFGDCRQRRLWSASKAYLLTSPANTERLA
jgi:hypothetical protein